MKFAIYNCSSNSNRVTYGTIKDHICNQIKKNSKYGADIAKHLSKGNNDHMPAVPVRTRAKKKSKEQRNGDIKFMQDTLDMTFREQLK